MPVVNVSTPKYCTVPKSPSVSISASATPPMIAGRASGRDTCRKLCHGVRPSVRLTSIAQTDWSRKATRASR